MSQSTKTLQTQCLEQDVWRSPFFCVLQLFPRPTTCFQSQNLSCCDQGRWGEMSEIQKQVHQRTMNSSLTTKASVCWSKKKQTCNDSPVHFRPFWDFQCLQERSSPVELIIEGNILQIDRTTEVGCLRHRFHPKIETSALDRLTAGSRQKTGFINSILLYAAAVDNHFQTTGRVT